MSRKAKTLRELESHFKLRIAQRYGISLGNRYAELNRQIQQGRATFIARESGTRTHWRIMVDGRSVLVVYNKALGGIVTALPTSERAETYIERLSAKV